MAKKKQTFEEQLKQLEEIVELLDSGEAPLEEMLKKYEEGMAIAKNCRKFLDEAEQKVIDISKEEEKQDEEEE